LTLHNQEREQRNLEILGERLRAVRESRGMSSLQLAAAMESSLTSIRDWENGARKLQSDTVRRLADALELSYPEEIYWLGLAGHIPSTRMPAKKQIITALEAYYQDLSKLNYPVQIIDHHFRYWVVNPATIDFAGSYMGLRAMMENGLTALDVIFNSNIDFFGRISKPEDITSRQAQLVRRIIGRSIHRRHEAFYQNYPEFMRQRLSDADYTNFIRIWSEVDSVKDKDEQQPHLADDIVLRNFNFNYHDGRTRNLQMRTDHIRYFGDLFELTLFHPPQPDTQGVFKTQAKEGLKLWEVINIDHLMRQYNG